MQALAERGPACNAGGVSDVTLDRVSLQPAHERIVEAARDLFCRHGIHATGIDRILAVAGASKMALYGRFGSKEALLREVLSREGADWRAGFFARIAMAGADPMQQLQSVAAAMEGWYQSGRFYGCAFMNAVAEHDKSEVWLREAAAEHHGHILRFLAAVATQAGLAEAEVVAKQILLLIDGATAALMVTNDAGVLTIMDRTLSAVLNTAARAT